MTQDMLVLCILWAFPMLLSYALGWLNARDHYQRIIRDAKMDALDILRRLGAL